MFMDVNATTILLAYNTDFTFHIILMSLYQKKKKKNIVLDVIILIVSTYYVFSEQSCFNELCDSTDNNKYNNCVFLYYLD